MIIDGGADPLYRIQWADFNAIDNNILGSDSDLCLLACMF